MLSSVITPVFRTALGFSCGRDIALHDRIAAAAGGPATFLGVLAEPDRPPTTNDCGAYSSQTAVGFVDCNLDRTHA
jgi:hypothetical protein